MPSTRNQPAERTASSRLEIDVKVLRVEPSCEINDFRFAYAYGSVFDVEPRHIILEIPLVV